MSPSGDDHVIDFGAGVIGCPYRAEGETLRAALRSLSNAVRGALGFAEPELRAVLGNTNVNCIVGRLEQAAVVLSGAGETLPPATCKFCEAKACPDSSHPGYAR